MTLLKIYPIPRKAFIIIAFLVGGITIYLSNQINAGNQQATPDMQCLSDSNLPNQCDFLGRTACNEGGVFYCTNYSTPVSCQPKNDVSCKSYDSTPCGQKYKCDDHTPVVIDGSIIDCTGAPDNCETIQPFIP